LFDPQYVSSQFFVVDGKIAGANALRDAATKTGRFDYDTPIDGLAVIDRYTLRIRLTQPDLNFPHVLAQQNLGAVAREIVEYYGSSIRSHPVGTGPFQLVSWREGSKLIVERNPLYREEFFPDAPADADEEVKQLAARLQGRRLPMVDRIELAFTVEDQPQWLSFVNGDLDYLTNVPVAFRPSGVPGGKLAPNLARQGVVLHNYVYPAVWYTLFNMKDPVVGGYSAEKVALRRAIALAFDNHAAIEIAMNGGGLSAVGLVPPGVPGYDADVRPGVFEHDVAKARALLDSFGYVDRDGDGWRETPDGKPLTIAYMSPSEPRFRPWDELWAKAAASIGIRFDARKVHQAEMIKQMQTAKFQMSYSAWNMDYPDGEDFYVVLHGPGAGFANFAHFMLPEYDRLFEASQKLVDSPARNAIYRRMDKLYFAYMPAVLHLYLRRSAVNQPWLTGFIPHPVHLEPWKYLDIDPAARAARRG
jgi:ABC-type transport system substrate-binding protein